MSEEASAHNAVSGANGATLLTVPYTPHPTPYTLHTTHYTLHLAHYALHTAHYTLHTTSAVTVMIASEACRCGEVRVCVLAL